MHHSSAERSHLCELWWSQASLRRDIYTLHEVAHHLEDWCVHHKHHKRCNEDHCAVWVQCTKISTAVFTVSLYPLLCTLNLKLMQLKLHCFIMRCPLLYRVYSIDCDILGVMMSSPHKVILSVVVDNFSSLAFFCRML